MFLITVSSSELPAFEHHKLCCLQTLCWLPGERFLPIGLLVYIEVYAYAIIVHTRANQLLPQFSLQQFDTLPIQCRPIEHMHEVVWF